MGQLLDLESGASVVCSFLLLERGRVFTIHPSLSLLLLTFASPLSYLYKITYPCRSLVTACFWLSLPWETWVRRGGGGGEGGGGGRTSFNPRPPLTHTHTPLTPHTPTTKQA